MALVINIPQKKGINVLGIAENDNDGTNCDMLRLIVWDKDKLIEWGTCRDVFDFVDASHA